MLLEGKKLKDKLSKMEEIDRNKQYSKYTNTNSEKYITQKFLREFDRLTSEMFFDSFADQTENQEPAIHDDLLKLNYIRFKELLMKLGMISEITSHSAPPESQEASLILELW